MSDLKPKRIQHSKAEKRALAEETTKFAIKDELKRKNDRDAKTQRLRALRLERQQSGTA